MDIACPIGPWRGKKLMYYISAIAFFLIGKQLKLGTGFVTHAAEELVNH